MTAWNAGKPPEHKVEVKGRKELKLNKRENIDKEIK